MPTELRKLAKGWQWGFEIPENAKRHRFFKLKLDEPDTPNRDGETPLQLTRIYLSCLHDHFISILEKKLSRSVVQSMPMDFVVTVPAIWSNTAKQATERAAAMAGFCGNRRIHLISEPVREHNTISTPLLIDRPRKQQRCTQSSIWGLPC